MPNRRLIRRFSILHALAIAVLVLSVIGTALFRSEIVESHARLQQEVRVQSDLRARQLTDALARQVEALIGLFDMALGYLSEAYLVQEEYFASTLQITLKSFPQGSVNFVAVIDRNGLVSFTSDGTGIGTYLGDRAHFQFHSTHPGTEMLISPPVESRIIEGWAIPFSRAIYRDGTFLGAVVLSVSPWYVSDCLRATSFSEGDIAALVLADGSFLARSPNIDTALGRKVPKDRPFLDPQAGDQSHYRSTSTIDGRELNFSWKRLHNGKLVAAVGLNELPEITAMIAQAEANLARADGIVLGVLVSAFGVAGLLLWVERQRQTLARGSERYRALMETASDGLHVVDDRGRLVEASASFLASLGYDRNEASALTLFDWNTRVSPQYLAALFDPAATTPGVLETWHRRRDGSEFEVEISWRPFDRDNRRLLYASSRDLTFRRQAERKLLEREALYRASIEATNDGFWLVDMQGRILDVNSAYAEESGYAVDQLTTMSVADLEALEGPDDTAVRIAFVQANGSATFETRHRRADGSLWDVEVKVIYSDVEGGRCFAFLHDLRRKRRADALLRARLRLSDIGRMGRIDPLMTEVLDIAERLTASTIGFFHFVDDDQQTLTLQAWSTNTLANMCKAEAKGLHYPVAEAGLWADCLREARPIILNDYDAATTKRGMPEGHAPVTRLLAVPVRGESGFTAVIGVGNKAKDYDQEDLDLVGELATIAMDLVNWLRAEDGQRRLAAALAETARQWTAAVNSVGDGIALLDRDNRLVRANAAYYQLTGYSAERLVGRQVHCLTDLDAGLPDCPVCNAFQNESAHFTLEADDPGNPSSRPLDVRITPITTESGEFEGKVLSLYDLTAVRNQEKFLRDTIAQLTRIQADQERFAKVTAHDLQEPTRRQILYAQLLRRHLTSTMDPELGSYIEQIVADAFKMRQMVLGLQVYFETELSAKREPVDLDLVMDEVRRHLKYDIDAVHGEIQAESLGSAQAEPSRVQRLFLNLIGNSLRFRRPETPPRIRVTAEPQGPWLEIAVADNGIGIPEQHRAAIFTPFARLQADSLDASPGMGLAQCRHIVEGLGGRIWIEGNDDNGTTVKFTLPR